MLPSAIRKQKSFNLVPAISLGELLFTDTDLSLPISTVMVVFVIDMISSSVKLKIN